MGWGPILLKNLTTSKNNQTIVYIIIYIHIFIFITIKFLTKPLRVLEDKVNKQTNKQIHTFLCNFCEFLEFQIRMVFNLYEVPFHAKVVFFTAPNFYLNWHSTNCVLDFVVFDKKIILQSAIYQSKCRAKVSESCLIRC